MPRIIQQHLTLAARSLSRLVLAVLVALLLTTSVADAALTTGACLAQKRVAWATLRKCQGTEEAKQLKGKPADLAQCLTKLQTALVKITAKATKAKIPCRYGNNGDGTVTDYDTGLMWEQKDGADGVPALDNPHDVDNRYTWSLAADIFRTGTAFTDFLARLDDSESSDGVTEGPCFVGHCDWRLPTIVELRGIVDLSASACGVGSPCIAPVFGPTVALNYWSATTVATNPFIAWFVYFDGGVVFSGGKAGLNYVRAVRGGL
jgi:hypothetical protein